MASALIPVAIGGPRPVRSARVVAQQRGPFCSGARDNLPGNPDHGLPRPSPIEGWNSSKGGGDWEGPVSVRRGHTATKECAQIPDTSEVRPGSPQSPNPYATVLWGGT